MNVILVHPEDSLESAVSSGKAQDLIVDLGWSGSQTYADLSNRLGCEVVSIYGLLDHDAHRDRLRELMSVGVGQVVDSEGIDWWEVFSANLDHSLSELLMLSALADRIPANSEVYVTRAHAAVDTLSILMGRAINVLSGGSLAGRLGRTQHLAKKLSTLRFSQILEIAGDKWDTDYQLRRLLSRTPSPSTGPVVLLPSAYQNVSRVQIAYARMLPDRRFLLVTTRRNGRVKAPPNVTVRPLATYAPTVSAATEEERQNLLRRWEHLKTNRLRCYPLLCVGLKQGAFEPFEALLRNGLRIRDAWRNVFAAEPIVAVLSGDENNEFTRLASILANSRNVYTVACDHGALNLTLALRKPRSEIYLAAGEMARDYMVNWCGLDPGSIEIGAPQSGQRSTSEIAPQGKDWIVFFSAPHEIAGGRMQVLYSQILPELCRLAAQTKRKVVVKLHPFESRAERKMLMNSAVDAPLLSWIELREGPMAPDLLERAWFTITINSSVTIDSTMKGVPCFLCSWFDAGWYDYGKQFAKYGAGHELTCANEIRTIPERLKQIRISDKVQNGLRTPIQAARLDAILFGG